MTDLADDFFCLVLDEHSGRTRLTPRVTGVGLAAALLGELVISGYAEVTDAGEIHALDVQRPPDPLTHDLHELLLARPQHRDLATWISFLARDSFTRVGDRLVRLGLLATERKRRLTGTHVRYRPVDASAVALPGVRIPRQLGSGVEITLADLTCAGLAVATGLINQVLWDNELHVPARTALPEALRLLPAPVTTLLARTETAVADAVLTTRT